MVARQLETGGMQGLMARAYGHLPYAAYVLFGINDPRAARGWLGRVAEDVDTADHAKGYTPALVLAFTWNGLRRLGLDEDGLATFPRSFQEGMVTEHRSRLLADSGASDPELWRWGGPGHAGGIHGVLAIYALTESDLDEAYAERSRAYFEGGALVEVSEPIRGLVLGEQGKEHFGFADGLSQPVISGWPRRTASQQPPAAPPPPDSKWAEVSPGEVVLGYTDNFGKLSIGPTVAATTDGADLLPAEGRRRGARRHLGHNGSFLVFRQLAQDVARFNDFVGRASRQSQSGHHPLTPELVAAKSVGRWHSGVPLTLSPDDPEGPAGPTSDFGYHDTDQRGLQCPVGAHVRRANPRDSSDGDPDKALRTTRNHRILRRGRSYGQPLVPGSAVPEEQEGAERGLLFICLNADIERQFEFVQHTWLVNPTFGRLQGEVDPLVGTQPAGGGRFTVQCEPVRQRFEGLPDFVTTKGGAYFFLPGIKALRYLASLPG